MSKCIEVPITSKDKEIYAYIKKANNISPIFVTALDYYILTGKPLVIGTVHEIEESEEKKIRLKLYIPDNSLSFEWAEKTKNLKRGLLTTKIKEIIRNSIEKADDNELEDFKSLDYCMLEYDKEANPFVPKKQKEVNEPQIVSTASEIPLKKETKENYDNTEKAVVNAPKEKKPKKTTIMEKLMPPDFG